jgi:hypothetical protein
LPWLIVERPPPMRAVFGPLPGPLGAGPGLAVVARIEPAGLPQVGYRAAVQERDGRSRPSSCPQMMTSGLEVDRRFLAAVLLDLVGDFLPFMETVEP